MNDQKRSPDKINSVLSVILIVLLSVTILAVLVMGGMFVLRLTHQNTPPDVTPPSTSNTDPTTDSRAPATTDPSVTDAPHSDPPATDAPNTDAPATAPVTDPVTEPVTDPVTDPVTEAPVVPPSLPDVYLKETADGGDAYLDRLVFLGDSTTYHMHHYTDLKDTQIWVPQAGTLDLYDITNKSIAMPVEGVDYRDWVDAPIISVSPISSSLPSALTSRHSTAKRNTAGRWIKRRPTSSCR